MLSDILATIIAFISIILLLSMVVTAMVQASQAILRLRSRNLMKGLAALLVNARTVDEETDPKALKKARSDAKRDATRILNASNVALMDKVNEPDTSLRYWLLGPKVSWMHPDELPPALEEAKVSPGSKSPEELTEDFRKSETHLKKRFLLMTRSWSIGWALLVAIAFQISAPSLFSELANDAGRRDRIVADADHLLAHQAESLSRMSLDLVAPDALVILADRHAEYREQIEQAIGIGTTRMFLLEELDLALERVAERDELVAEYDLLLDEVADRKFEETAEEVKYAVDRLRDYHIELWPRGKEYYYRSPGGLQWAAIVGVLITAILLSFGGSFWFEQLRNVIALRDPLGGSFRARDTESEENEEQRRKQPATGKHEDRRARLEPSGESAKEATPGHERSPPGD